MVLFNLAVEKSICKKRHLLERKLFSPLKLIQIYRLLFISIQNRYH